MTDRGRYVVVISEESGDGSSLGRIRRGSDILKAVALGANAAMVGRPYLYGLGAGGEKGVDWVLDFFEDGLRRTMALCGVNSLGVVTSDLVNRR